MNLLKLLIIQDHNFCTSSRAQFAQTEHSHPQGKL